MKKGDILTAVYVEEDESGCVVRTDAGHVLGIVSARGVKVGQKMQVGPVCGDWCRLFLMGGAYQARLLVGDAGHEEGAPDTQTENAPATPA